VAFVVWKRSSLVLALVSPEIGRTSGIDVARLHLLFLQAFALTVALVVGAHEVLPAGGPPRARRRAAADRRTCGRGDGPRQMIAP